jgi:hypothetical protein
MIARYVALALVVFAAACDSSIGSGPVGPGPATPNSQDLTGTWDATFVVTVAETDIFVMELRQDGNSLSGAFAHHDLVGPLVLSGSVNGGVASVVGVLANPEGTCRLTVTAEMASDRDGRTMFGPMTATGEPVGATPNPDCKPSFQVGSVSAVKR